MNQATPQNLVGYQSLCNCHVLPSDLAIPDYAINPSEWDWAGVFSSLCGKFTDEKGLCDGFRIYRLCECAKKLEPVAQPSPNAYRALTNDQGKVPLAMLPWAGIRDVAMVQSYGNDKYGDFYNYRKGMEITRHLSCALRHISLFLDREDRDRESGHSHLAHAACRILYVLQNQHDGTAIDDRFKTP
jgi:hypothetical protein